MNGRLFALNDTTTTDDWYTPPWVFEGLGITFDVDVCSPDGGVPWIPTERYFTESDDGLAQPWEGVVWCNPPYSNPALWCHRWSEHEPGGLILIRSDLSSSGPYAAFKTADGMFYPQRRMQFVNGQGGSTGSVAFSTVILSRGKVATDALVRLGSVTNGATRRLTV